MGAALIGLAPAVAYPTNEPVWENSVLFSVEVHSGRGATATSHAATLRTDLLRLDLPLLVCNGDLTENGLSSEDTTGLAVLDSLPATEIRAIVGNHDLQPPRSGDDAATAWGLPGTKDWTFDLGPVKVIGLSPPSPADPLGGDGSDPSIILTTTELDFLDDELTAAGSKDCWVVCHAPLQGALTNDPDWYVTPAAEINAILDAHDNAIAWFSGHIHTGFEDNDMAVLKSVGTRSVVNANASAIAYVNPGDDFTDPIRSLLATHIPGGVDLRIRDHKLRYYWQWPTGEYVRTLEAT